MNKLLNGKYGVVTGGTRGIGRAITSRLLAAGASIAICGRSEQSVDRALTELAPEAGGKVIGKAADVSNSVEVGNFFRFVDDNFGGLDLLVNNAGVGRFTSVSEMTVEEWDRMIGTNLSGAFYCSHEALLRFRSRGGGYVINISSLAGKNAFAGGAAYNSSKFGLNGFSEALMQDHRYDNVRVSYIMPGSVATEFGSGIGDEWKIAPEDVAEIVVAMLRLPARTLMSAVEVRPSRPPRK